MSPTDEEYVESGLRVLSTLGWIRDEDDRTPPAGYPDATLWRYTVGNLWGRIWARPGLSLRDRQLATIAALIYLRDDKSLAMHLRHCHRAGITTAQVRSTIILVGHYAGWPAMEAAYAVLKGLEADMPNEEAGSEEEAVSLSEPQTADGEQWYRIGLSTLADLGWNRNAEDAEPPIVGSDQGFWDHTIEALFGRAYSVPALSLKDKQIVVMATIISHSNQVGIRTHYLRRHNAGVTEREVRELLLQVGYYTGWPCFSVGTIWFNQLLEESGDQWPTSMRSTLPDPVATTSSVLSGPNYESGSK